MGKNKDKNKQKKPVVLSMMVSLEGLESIPEGFSSQKMMLSWVVTFVDMWVNTTQSNKDEKLRGLKREDALKFWRIRDLMKQAVDSKSEYVELEYEDFQFLNKCRLQANIPVSSNESFKRIDDKFEEAVSRYDREKAVASS